MAEPSGRISADMLRELVPDAASRTAYVCGSEGFMSTARAAAMQVGVGTVHAESFGGMTPPHDSGSVAKIGAKGTVTFADSAQSYDCAAGETILDAAAANGLWISAACRQGVCGTGKARLVAG